jgi:hypothetical protein
VDAEHRNDDGMIHGFFQLAGSSMAGRRFSTTPPGCAAG